MQAHKLAMEAIFRKYGMDTQVVLGGDADTE